MSVFDHDVEQDARTQLKDAQQLNLASITVHFKYLVFFLGCLPDSPPTLMMHSPQMPDFHTMGQQSPPQTKKHVSETCSDCMLQPSKTFSLYINVFWVGRLLYLFVFLQEQRPNLVGIKEEKPSHSPVLPPSPFSSTMRQDAHKPDNKHSESWFYRVLWRLNLFLSGKTKSMCLTY